MTVEKAIKILDWWIAHKKKVMERLRRKWDYSIYDEVEGIAETIFAITIIIGTLSVLIIKIHL